MTEWIESLSLLEQVVLGLGIGLLVGAVFNR
ncbi:membrane protein [Mycobacterium phage Superchunk]|nr:membrane protein [Mycobacterium phage Superchunk]